MSALPKTNSFDASLLVKLAGACAAVGIGTCLTEYAEFGRWLTVVGVVLLIVGLHRFGRSGPDAIIYFEVDPAPRKKKKKKRALDLPVDDGPNQAES